MIKVTVTSSKVREMKGTSAAGKPYHLFFQDLHFHVVDAQGNPNEFPDKAEIMLEKDPAGNPIVYQPGKYQMHPSSVYVGRDGVAIKPVLVPVGTGKPAA